MMTCNLSLKSVLTLKIERYSSAYNESSHMIHDFPGDLLRENSAVIRLACAVRVSFLSCMRELCARESCLLGEVYECTLLILFESKWDGYKKISGENHEKIDRQCHQFA